MAQAPLAFSTLVGQIDDQAFRHKTDEYVRVLRREAAKQRLRRKEAEDRAAELLRSNEDLQRRCAAAELALGARTGSTG